MRRKKWETLMIKIDDLKEHEEIRSDSLEALNNEILPDAVLKILKCPLLLIKCLCNIRWSSSTAGFEKDRL
ncbi:MAG: hypothetical protein AB1502_11490 [Thermodesulfobacteriota bacterium]